MRENMPEMDTRRLQSEADKVNAEAAFCQGDCFLKGIGTEKNARKAVQMYRAAANAGYAPAQHQMGVCYETGTGVVQNLREAVKWYRKAAENLFPPAMISLGRCCEKGLGQNMDLEEAAQWYRCAGRTGECLGDYHLARLLEAGQGVEKDPEKAAEYYLSAARGNIIAAQVAVGRCFRDGSGVEQDEQKAFEWFSVAAERGNPIAQWNVGNCYERGIGTAADPTAATKWYQKAAEQDFVPAIRDLGRCLRDGIGEEFDIERSIALLERAAAMNDLAAMEELAVCMMLGLGRKKDIAGAAKLYRRIRGGRLLNEAQLEEALRSRLEPAKRAFCGRIEKGKHLRERKAEQERNVSALKELRALEKKIEEMEERLRQVRRDIDEMQTPAVEQITDLFGSMQGKLVCKEPEKATALAAEYADARKCWEATKEEAYRFISDQFAYFSNIREEWARYADEIGTDESGEILERCHAAANSFKNVLGGMEGACDRMIARAAQMLEVCGAKEAECRSFVAREEERLQKWKNCCDELEQNDHRCCEALKSMETSYSTMESVLRAAQAEKEESERGLTETQLLLKKWESDQTAEAVRDMRELRAAAEVACVQAGRCLDVSRDVLKKNQDAAACVQNYPDEAIDVDCLTEEYLEECHRKARVMRTVLEQMLRDKEALEKQKETTDAIAARLLKIEELRTEILSGVRTAVAENWIDFGDAGPEMALEEANRLIRQKEQSKAVAWLRKAAELGSAEAQNQLAYLYERGKMICQNKEEAFYWYRLAAEQGYPVAECNLAVCYAEGVGIEKDMVQAVEWYRKAAQNQEPRAQYQMGRFCLDGTNMPKNEEQAANWFRLAAEQGHAGACLELAECFRKGIGVPQNLQQVMYWVNQAKKME